MQRPIGAAWQMYFVTACVFIASTLFALDAGSTLDRLELAFTGALKGHGPVRETRIAGAPQEARASGHQAAPRKNKNFMMAHADLLKKGKSGRIDIYFEGDSIVRRWGATDYPELLANWKHNFFGWNAADFGWGGDKTQNILWRLENGELDGPHPKVIVLLAGTNNVTEITRENESAKVEEITDGIQAILKFMQGKVPDATIVLTGIFPRNDRVGLVPAINKINSNISQMANGNSVRYVNINDKLADSNGKVFDGMLNDDQLHPTLRTYQIWADALKPILIELLGPPAKEDHAPPPTGDISTSN